MNLKTGELPENFGGMAHHEPFLKPYLLRPGDVFVDVGAHVGRWALPASQHYERVIAVEPHPTSADLLIDNAVAVDASNLEIHQSAVGMEPGFTTLNLPYRDSPIHAWVGPGEHPIEGEMDVRHAEVHVTTLDELLADAEGTVRIKIDTEGHELSVLKGGLASIKRLEPELFVEVHTEAQEILIRDWIEGHGLRYDRVDQRLAHPVYLRVYT